MRRLLIAPHSTHAGLPDAERELQHVANAPDARLLMGGVTVHDVLAALDDAYDCVWFACHGTEDGIVLSDGVLPAARLVQMLRAHPPHLVVLNTCSSLRTAMHIHDTLHCAVVATITDVLDLTAFVTGTLLARGLAEGLSIADAYARSLPGDNREYVLLNGSLRMGNADPFDDLKALLAHALKRQDRIHDDIAAVRAELDAARPRLIHLLTWSAGYALLVVALLLTATAVTLGLDLPETLAIVALLAALAGGLLWRGRNLT